jgi:hypothetical protein
MTSSDDPRPEQPAEPPQEVQRNLPHVLGQLAQHAGDESVKVAAKYATVKALEKVFGGRDSDKGSGESGPPSSQGPPETEWG